MANFLLEDVVFGCGLEAVAFVIAFPIALYFLYRYLLPKPLPGIPYNPEALASVLGDIPDLMKDDRGAMDWLLEQSRRHQGPVCQVFLRPLGKPYVLLSDFREAQDILMRRKEWDRSDYSIDLLGGQAPFHHINQKTGPVWKAHRRLIQDLMQPKFLNEVAAPNIYSSTLDLVHLWTKKEILAGGRSFSAEQDIFYASLDAVLEFSFGPSFPHRAIPPQREILDDPLRQSFITSPGGTTAEFSYRAVDETIQATLRASEVVGELVEAPFPRLTWRLKSWMPSEAKNVRIRHKYLKEQIHQAVERLESEKSGTDDAWIKSAVDLMMQREQRSAEKEGRAPVYWSPVMRDEIFGFVIGGHDTLSTTILWGLKFLSDHKEVQDKLRADLRKTHAQAFEQKRMPTADEITNGSSVYLNATINEILRLASSIAILDRQATRDTQLLGHHIPKGTIIMMMNRGPSFTEPALPIKESLRSPSSQDASEKTRSWLRGHENQFIPDRWLAGETVMEPPPDGALPSLGLGSKLFRNYTRGRNLETRTSSPPPPCYNPQENVESARASSSGPGRRRQRAEGVPKELAWDSDGRSPPYLPFGLGTRGCYGKKLAILELNIVFTLIIWNFELVQCPEKLSGYDAVETLTHKPRQCFVSLKKLGKVE